MKVTRTIIALVTAGTLAGAVWAQAQQGPGAGMGPGMMGGSAPGVSAGPRGGTSPGNGQGYGPGYGMGPGMGGYGPGYGMRPGMGGYGPGYGMSPGMMGGYGPGYGMGPGMMGGYGPGMMMGPGMMGGYGPGMMGWRWGNQQTNLNLSPDDVKGYFQNWIAFSGNPHIKVGNVAEKNADTVTADIVTTDKEGLVQRYEVDRRTGWLRPAAS